MDDRRSILEEAARMADFYADELERLSLDAWPLPKGTKVSVKDFVQQQLASSRHTASANTARALAREFRDLIDHPKPHITDQPLIVASRRSPD